MEKPDQDVYSPSASYTTIRVVYAINAAQQRNIACIDAKQAFLHCETKEPISYSMPQSVHVNDQGNCFINLDGYDHDHIMTSTDNYYGLVSAPATWNQRFTRAFLNSEMTQSRIDPTFFFNSDRLSAVQVDDTLSSGTSRQQLEELASALRDDGVTVTIDHEPTVFCGLQVHRDRNGITLFAKRKINHLISKCEVDCCLRTPYAERKKLYKGNLESSSEAISRYRSVVGSLIWITIVRPDILFSTLECSRFSSNPQPNHWEAVLNILRYLKSTPTLGIH